MNLYLDDVLAAIGEPEAEFRLSMKWTPYAPCEDDPDFSEGNILHWAKMTGCDDIGTDRLCQAAAFLRGNEMFRIAAVLMYREIFVRRGSAYVHFSAVDEKLGESIRMLIRLFSAKTVWRVHQDLNIPPQYSRDTLHYLRATKDNFAGCFPKASSYFWLRQLMDPEMMYLHIVRLGFALAPRDWFNVIFRHQNGSFLTFAKPNLYVTPAGILIPKEDYEREGGTVTVFRVEHGYFYGHVIDETGRVAIKPEKIPMAGYELYLADGMPVINMHIPAGGGLTMDLVRESWRQAKQFYTARLGLDCPKAIACGSWTCSPVMEEVLPPEANLVKFVKSFRRLPTDYDSHTIFIHTGTSLSRAIEGYIQSGKRFRDGSMFLPLDEIE